MRGVVTAMRRSYSKNVSSCEYGGAQQQRIRSSLVPLFSSDARRPAGMSTASPGRTCASRRRPPSGPALEDEVDLLARAVVVALGRLLGLERRLGEALHGGVVELADRRAVLRDERLDAVDRRDELTAPPRAPRRRAPARPASSAVKNGSARRARARVLRHRAQPLAEAVALAHVRLQVDRRQIAVEADRLALEVRDHALARRVVGQLARRRRTTSACDRVVRARQSRRRRCRRAARRSASRRRSAAQGSRRASRPARARAPRATSLEPVVEAEPHVLEPAAGVAAALVAQRAQQPPLLLRVRRDDPALAGRHLLVRIEREDRARPVRADRRALVLRAERLARVLDERETVLLRDRAQRVELARIAVDVDGDDRLRPRRHRRLDRGRIEVQRRAGRCPRTPARRPRR